MTNIRLQQIEAKYEVDKAIIQELNPKLSITPSGYEKLTEQGGASGALETFRKSVSELKSQSKN